MKNETAATRVGRKSEVDRRFMVVTVCWVEVQPSSRNKLARETKNPGPNSAIFDGFRASNS
jgi:hypothetical protein